MKVISKVKVNFDDECLL